MVFSSHLFCFFFLPLALLVYYLLPRRARHLGLTALSYGFYGWANPAFMLLMLFSTAVDFVCGSIIAAPVRRAGGGFDRLPPGGPRSRRQRGALALSIISNLSLLGCFKYAGFAATAYNQLATWAGGDAAQLIGVLHITLPLGISFYTFQSMSYSIDVYRGEARALSHPIDFACFVSMFPQLVAGPILRFSEIADQLRNRTHTLEKLARGCAFFSLGLGKKVLLANPCGEVADLVFAAADRLPVDAWYGCLAYAFQIYFDFSGYSDMAIGLGLMLGFVFPKNFDAPYRATSITDFWRRWHLSLSHFLRDYLYIPLGGNRRGTVRTYGNLMVVMLLGGLWHGAAWTFIAWGGVHGLLLAGERLGGGARAWAPVPRPLRIALVFLAVALGWVLFRSPTLVDAMAFFGSMLGLNATAASAELVRGMLYRPYDLSAMALAALTVWALPQTWDFTRRLSAWRIAWCLIVFLLALAAMETQGYNPFIYFIF